MVNHYSLRPICYFKLSLSCEMLQVRIMCSLLALVSTEGIENKSQAGRRVSFCSHSVEKGSPAVGNLHVLNSFIYSGLQENNF